MSRPHSETRRGFEDTTARRVQLRLVFMGWSQERLGVELGTLDGTRALTGAAIRNYLCGRRPWEHRNPLDPSPSPIDRFARALGLPVGALRPGTPWDRLVDTNSVGGAP